MSALKLIKVQCRDAYRVFNSITHPTENGSSRLTFKSKKRVPTELLLLVDLLTEEYQAKPSTPTVVLEGWRALDKLPPMRERLPSFIGDEEIPPPPPEVICEFDLFVAEFNRPTGRVVAAVFHGLTMTTVKPKVHYVQRQEPSREARSDIETTGVWRTAARHQRLGNEAGQDKKRQAG